MRNWFYIFFLVGVVTFFVTPAIAQSNSFSQSRTNPFSRETDGELALPEASEDEEPVQKKKFVVDTTYFKHSPSKAMIFSAVVPGLGQAYNKKYWKIPVVYAALGGCAYWFWFSNTKFIEYRDGYISYMDKDPTTNYFRTMDLRGLDASGNVINADLVKRELESFKNGHDRNRSLAILSLVFVYALNIIDASVDAHLFNFDVSEEVSMRIDPIVIPAKTNTPNQYGVAWKINF
ncbi:MAG: DUF5683 domain-containing protein [Bacteroidales bacterium]|nr:DUF5683 domain-containing protein [Bacteroidales bacterium]